MTSPWPAMQATMRFRIATACTDVEVPQVAAVLLVF